MVWGVIAGLGPGVTEGLNYKEDRAASKSRRTIAEAEEGRAAERHDWLKGLAKYFEQRNAVEDPEAWKQFYSGGLYQPQPAPTQPQPAIGAEQQTVEQALPALQTIRNMGQGFQEGGPVQVPEQQMGPPALPMQQGPQQGPQQAPPPQAEPQVSQKRRDRYQQWYDQAAKYSILNGGLEGYQKFEEMENAASRRQVMGYALQAVRAMDEGNVGEAMRAGNAALEVTPFDTGLKFEARNGKLHMVGPDGQPGEPLTADHLRAFTEDHMKTPESYLDWKKQAETERSNLVQEGISAKNAESTRRQVDQYVEEGPSRIYGREAGAYRDLAAGRAALENALAKGETHESWDTKDIRGMERDITDAAHEGKLGFNGAWDRENMAGTPLGDMPISLTKDIRRINQWDAMTDNLAASIARGALMNYIPDASGEPLLKDGKVAMDDETGKYYFVIGGNEYLVPEVVGIGLNMNLKQNEQLLSGSQGKE